MSKSADPPIPIRLPTDLLDEIEAVSKTTKLSKQDIMRLCMRIGLVDLAAAEHDFPGIVKRIADDKGVSFQEFAKAKSQPAPPARQGHRVAKLDTSLNQPHKEP